MSRVEARFRASASVACGVLAMIVAAGPLLVAAAATAIGQPSVMTDGDVAIQELALVRSAHLAQLLGTYSRFQFNHPGPAWFYALDAIYVPLGEHSWAYYAAVLALHGLFAAAIVAIAWRRGGPLLAIVASVLVLLYIRAAGETVFRIAWPIYGLLLPMILLFLLAASGAAGSTPAMVGALVVGSYLVQLHIGTLPIVVAVIVSMGALRLATHRFGRWAAAEAQPAPGRSSPLPRAVLTAGGAVVLVVMWIPVAVDQLTGSPGNLTRIYAFFTTPHGRHGYHLALSLLGSLLELYPFGHLDPRWIQPPFFGPEAGPVPADRLVAVAIFLVAAVGLAALAWLLRDRFALALAVLVAVAVPVAVVSIVRVVGPLYPYLLAWATTLPVPLALGWAALLARLRPWARWRAVPARVVARAAVPALCVAAVALAAGRVAAFQGLPALAGDYALDPYSKAAWTITDDRLGSEQPSSVQIYMADDGRWAMAGTLAVQLQKAGWTVTVNQAYVYMFGEAMKPSGHEAVLLVVVGRDNFPTVERQMPNLRLIGQTPNAYLLVGRPSDAGP